MKNSQTIIPNLEKKGLHLNIIRLVNSALNFDGRRWILLCKKCPVNDRSSTGLEDICTLSNNNIRFFSKSTTSEKDT